MCPGDRQDRFCWSSGLEPYCQTLTKTNPACSGCGEDRCFIDTETGLGHCCNPHCAAGCDGPSADRCHACRENDNDGTCVSACPPEVIYDPSSFQLVPNPDFKLAEKGFCVENCSDNLFKLGGECVEACSAGYELDEETQECLPCQDGVCPVVCEGSDSRTQNTIFHSEDVEELRGCTIITRNVVIGTLDVGVDVSSLEVLSSIQEIRGLLIIRGFQHESLPYLRNLRRVGSINATDLWNISCVETIPSSLLFLQNFALREIDLSSLEEVLGGGIAALSNPKLCFSGNLSLYSQQPNCIQPTYRKADDNCIDDDYICHSECQSRSSCWGRMDHQCDSCRNFAYLNRCLPNCSVVTEELPPTDPGVFTNHETRVCEPCHPQCVGGCPGGTGPSHCNRCRNLFLRVLLNETFVHTCVDSCPTGTYLEAGGSECLPCHEHCSREAGCAGPLPFLDMENGCLDCTLVQLNESGHQDMCVSGMCSRGYYRDILSPEQAASSNVGDLAIGFDVCIPCDPLCEVCTGPGSRLLLSQCQICRFAVEGSRCLRSCGENQFLDPQSRVCSLCASACDECTGPTSSQCIRCASGLFRQESSDGSSFHCVPSCGPGLFASDAGVCEDCHELCAECRGPESSNCTSCTPPHQMAGSAQPFTCLNCSAGECADQDSTALNNASISGIIIAAVMSVLIAIVIVMFLLGLIRRRSKMLRVMEVAPDLSDPRQREMIEEALLKEQELQPPKMAPNEARLIVISESALKFGDELGSGAFGTVYEGYWTPNDSKERYHVAIKVLNEGTASAEASKELLQEGVVMASMDHENVVRLYAISMGSRMMLISQFVPLGALTSYLKKYKEALNANNMLQFCLQIASGMSYLEEKRLVHRDLAARNVLVQSNRCVKITDFGLTKFLEVGEDHFKSTGGLVPIRWMAPESLKSKVYTHKSDVWSFGITVWEILTFGARPYRGKSARDILRMLYRGERLDQPATASIELYALLLECWLAEPECRPSFIELVSRLSDMLDDPLRYILTIKDGAMEDYNALPSNVINTGECTYENLGLATAQLADAENTDGAGYVSAERPDLAATFDSLAASAITSPRSEPMLQDTCASASTCDATPKRKADSRYQPEPVLFIKEFDRVEINGLDEDNDGYTKMSGDYDVMWDERQPGEYETPKKKSKASAKASSGREKAVDTSPPMYDTPEVLESSNVFTSQPALETDTDVDSGYFMDESAINSSPRKQNFNEYSPSPPPFSHTDNSSLAASNGRSTERSMSPPSLAVISHTQANGQSFAMAAGLTPDYELPIDAQRVLKSATLPAGDNYETPLDASI